MQRVCGFFPMKLAILMTEFHLVKLVKLKNYYVEQPNKSS